MTQALLDLTERFADTCTAVVGDLMLDRYIWGKASRISQEAPVPVVQVERDTVVPGGAANVVRNLTCLGGGAFACGAVGDDAHGAVLLRLLEEGGADTGGTVRMPDRRTTVKSRVIANNQQVVRIDREQTDPLGEDTRAAILCSLGAALAAGTVQAVILEDYAKGLLSAEFMQAVIDLARRHEVPVALDPHPSNPFQVKGLTLMTPNRAEAFGLAGVYYRPTVLPLEQDEALQEVGAILQKQWQVEHLLVTMGGDGMALFQPDGTLLHIPTQAREVFDVSGAGDTVMASFMLALLAGGSPAQCADLANHAAGVVVAKVGTVPVMRNELRDTLREPAE